VLLYLLLEENNIPNTEESQKNVDISCFPQYRMPLSHAHILHYMQVPKMQFHFCENNQFRPTSICNAQFNDKLLASHCRVREEVEVKYCVGG
jgi:hypothetical protein